MTLPASGYFSDSARTNAEAKAAQDAIVDYLIAGSQWVVAGGTANALTATYSPAIASLTDGLLLGVRATAANTSATVTFAPNGLTAHNITKLGGTALEVGEIANLQELLLRYNLANTRWEWLNPPSGQVSGTFTPTLAGTGTAGTPTYSVQDGRYVKLTPHLVWFMAHVTITAFGGSPTGNVRLRTLPFASSNLANAAAVLSIIAANVTLDSGYSQFTASIINNATEVIIGEIGSNKAFSNVPVGNVGATADIYICGVYSVGL